MPDNAEMLKVLHFDGIVLLVASICLCILGQSYYRWRFRVPMFCLAFCYFALSIRAMGLVRPSFGLEWFWLRLGADITTLVLASIYFAARRGHPHTVRHDHAERPTC